jgi:hypothetical protein
VRMRRQPMARQVPGRCLTPAVDCVLAVERGEWRGRPAAAPAWPVATALKSRARVPQVLCSLSAGGGPLAVCAQTCLAARRAP